MPRKRPGIRRHRGKPKAYVDVMIGGVPRQKTKTFPVGTADAVLAAWREQTRGRYATRTILPGSLGDLVASYLPVVKGKPTADQIAAHLQLWLDTLGADRDPASITGIELSAIMADWMATPTNQHDPTIRGRRGRPSAPTGVSAATVKKRRATLRRMFNVLYGKNKPNPVRDSVCPRVSTLPDERGIAVADALRLIAAMPDWAYPQRGQRVPSGAKRRAAVMLWTGLPPSLIAQIGPADLTALGAPVPTLQVRRRNKGGGVEARAIEVCAQAVIAVRALAAGGALGAFESGPFNVSVKRAACRAGIPLPPGFHAYDLRHTFGAALKFSGADDATVARLMMHADGSTVGRRYTRAAHRAVAVQAVNALDVFGAGAVREVMAGSGGGPVPPLVPKPAPKPARSAKLPRIRHLRRVS